MSTVPYDTRSVIERHWQALCRGDLPAMIAGYAADAVLINGVTGVNRGRDAIRPLLQAFLSAVVPPQSTRFTLNQALTEGGIGFIVWSAESATHRIPYSSDTFIIRDGRIVVQTSAAQLLQK